MMEEQKSTPTAAELEILTVLWEQQPLTVKEVHFLIEFWGNLLLAKRTLVAQRPIY